MKMMIIIIPTADASQRVEQRTLSNSPHQLPAWHGELVIFVSLWYVIHIVDIYTFKLASNLHFQKEKRILNLYEIYMFSRTLQDHSCGRCLQFLFQLIVLIVLNAALSTTIILDDPYSGDRYYDVNLEEVKIQDPSQL